MTELTPGLRMEAAVNVVDMKAFREKREEETWRAYTEARERAERTLDIKDGIAAGLAWRAWLVSWQTPEQNEHDREFNRILEMRRRG